METGRCASVICIFQGVESQFLVIVKLNSYMTFYQNGPPKQKRIDWGMKIRKVFARIKRKQTITISIAAGTYDTEIIIDLITQAIQDNKGLQSYRQKTNKLILSNGKSFSEKYPRSWMLKEELHRNQS